MELSTCCDAERWNNLESDICSSCKEHADFVENEESSDNIITCPRCDTELECLGGSSAHQSNWYCPDCCDDVTPNINLKWSTKTKSYEPIVLEKDEPSIPISKLQELEKTLSQISQLNCNDYGQGIAAARSEVQKLIDENSNG